MLALKAFGVAAAVFLVLDGIWLALVARGFYQGQIGELMRPSFIVAPAALFYLIYVGALVALAVLPAMEAGHGWTRAAIAGAILGLAAYGTYDLTNYATLKNWPLTLTLVDLTWGTAVSTVTAGATAAILGVWK